MRMIVCIKQVPAAASASIDPLTKTIVRTGQKAVTNPFDLHALQLALDLRQQTGGTITGITMGLPAAAAALRDGISRGMDGGVLLSDRTFAGADTLATSYALSRGIEKLGGADLILCGRMATDGDTAQIGPELAQQLGLPHVSDVCQVLEIAEDHLVVRRVWDELEQVLHLPLPAVITVVKSSRTPALPTLSGMLRAKDAVIPVWTAADVGADPERCGLRGSPTQVVRTFAPQARRQAQVLGGDVGTQAQALAQLCREVLREQD